MRRRLTWYDVVIINISVVIIHDSRQQKTLHNSIQDYEGISTEYSAGRVDYVSRNVK